jgi:hypothetical protein
VSHDADQQYVERLGAVLRTQDVEQLRGFLIENARRFGDEAQVTQITGQSAQELEALMHRMIVARSDLAELHPSSRTWLQQHGQNPPQAEPHRRN